jgi:hypothetical protein
MHGYKLLATLPLIVLAGVSVGCSSKPVIPPSAALAPDTTVAPGTPGPQGQTPSQPAPPGQQAPNQYPPDNTQPQQAATITLPEGVSIGVRLGETLDTHKNRAGDRFLATLDEPLVVDGKIVVPKGASFTGRVDECKASGRLKGRAVLSLSLIAFDLDGKHYRIDTSDSGRVSGRHRRRNIVLIAGGAGTGATIGAVAGGPVGAVVGAGAGAGTGTIVAVVTGKKNVRIPVETVMHFKLRAPVDL